MGPWHEGTPQQGFQSRLTPQEIYRLGIRETDMYCTKRYGKAFCFLTPEQQDEVLHDLEEGEVPLQSLSSKLFFSLLWRNTDEGFFSDPMYGGNRDKIGWKLIGFPGVASSKYNDHIEKQNVPYRAEPVSILDIQQKKVKIDEQGFPVARDGEQSGRMTDMTTKLKAVDVVVVGAGLTGSIMCKELSETGLRVVGFERGRMIDPKHDFAMPYIMDELKYHRHSDIVQNLSRETITFRNEVSERALPMRELGSFKPGECVGGAAAHWGGQARRFLPWDFVSRSRTIERYGPQQLPENCTTQDWGITYEELEPFYDQFEHLYGVCGIAGNLNGEIQQGGNPFEGPRTRPYPNPAAGRTVRRLAVRRRRAVARLSPAPEPFRGHVSTVRESVQADARPVRTIRLLQQPRLCERCASDAAHHRHSRARPSSEFRAPHTLQRDQGESRLGQEARRRHHLPRCAGPRVPSSRPISSSSRRTRSTTCACCCSRASANRTTR